MKQELLPLFVGMLATSALPALGQGIFQPSYEQTASFDGAPGGLTANSMNLTYDGSHYWSAAGGTQQGSNLAEWDGSGNYIATYQPGIDIRSVFTEGGSGSIVYARSQGVNDILQQTSPGVFGPYLTLGGAIFDAQAQVEFNSDGTGFTAHSNGTVRRWDASGNPLSDLLLDGFGSMFGESDYPQYRGMVSAGGYHLTYSNGNLSAWDEDGARVGTTELAGAGATFNSHFSLSWANGMVWVIDDLNGTWRGYRIPELLGGSNTYTCSVSGPCPGTVTVHWSNATPGRQQGIVFGNNLGQTTIPNGPCQGTVLGVSGNVHLVNTLGTGSGAGSVNGNAVTAACGHHLQLVEAGSCNTSTIGTIP